MGADFNSTSLICYCLGRNGATCKEDTGVISSSKKYILATGNKIGKRMARATKKYKFLAQATNSKKLRRDKSGLGRFWLVAIFYRDKPGTKKM
jgi:hypothetical protein